MVTLTSLAAKRSRLINKYNKKGWCDKSLAMIKDLTSELETMWIENGGTKSDFLDYMGY